MFNCSRGAWRRVLSRGLSVSTATHLLPIASNDVRIVFERSIACCESSRALEAFDKLPQESATYDPHLLQRLALLVAKRGQPNEVPRAAQILQHLITKPSFEADDATQLAFIYTLDACLRQERLEDALLLFEAVKTKDILVDLPSVNALLKMLVVNHRVDEAVGILRNVTMQHDVRPTEQTFQAVLVALMRQMRYEDVVAVIEHGRVNEVAFSPETYDLLVDLSQVQHTTKNAERLGQFMEYVNDALEMDGYWEEDDEDEGIFDDDDDDNDDDFDDDNFDSNNFDDEFD